MPRIEFVLAVGSYAHRWHLGGLARATLTETVAAWREILDETARGKGPQVIPLPHPSWRNNAWIKRNPWFEGALLPVLRAEIHRRLETASE
jgi:uracil-DNA glycosylase